MSSSRTPNKSRFIEAQTIYRDAMVPFIEEGMRSLKHGKSRVDDADIPFLIGDNRRLFPGLNHGDVKQMRRIRELWNYKIKHPGEPGDVKPEDTMEYAALCARVLRRCGLSKDADRIVSLFSPAPSTSGPALDADPRKEAERREWDKQRITAKPAQARTPLEQQRLADIEFEEDWEHRELQKREFAELAQLGSDIDKRRQWFDADPGRPQRHPSASANLQRDEQERARLAEERAAQERLMKERDELTQLGSDIGARQDWFDADPGREQRHPSEFADLQREQEDLAKERDELARLGSNLEARRDWFGANPNREQRHSSEFADLQREQERLATERDELSQLGSDVEAQRGWFSADPGREQRHPSAFADLQRAEQGQALLAKEQAEQEHLEEERRELAQLGAGIDIRRGWFDTDPGREQRHPSEFAELQCAEQERLEDEREELAQLGSNIAARRSWFDAEPGREQRHPSEFANLQRVPGRLAKEQAELAQLGSDIALRRSWFAADVRRRRRYQSEFTQLEQDELDQLGSDIEARRSWFNADVRRRQQYLPEFTRLERDELDQLGPDIEERQRWFKADPGRPQRHPSEFATLEQD